MRLTQAQRARRRATRRNNKVRRELPLLVQTGQAGQFMTTPAVELETIKSYDAGFDVYLQQKAERDRRALQLVALIRDEVAQEASKDDLAKLDKQRKVYASGTEYDLDFWHRVQRDWRAAIKAVDELEQVRTYYDEKRAEKR